MANICKHAVKPFYEEYYRRFVEPSEPSLEQIKKSKLYKCSKCSKWYSLLGRVLRPPLIIGE